VIREAAGSGQADGDVPFQGAALAHLGGCGFRIFSQRAKSTAGNRAPRIIFGQSTK
jgi:hypothetical protein